MKSIAEQLSSYKSVHLNGKNVKTHFVGIPLIIWSAAILLSSVVFGFTFSGVEYTVSLATIICLVITVYYFVLLPQLAIMVILLFGPIVYSAHFIVSNEHWVAIAISVFVIGWIFQFIGHAYEKAKPAFVDDLNQLLIGPLFLIAEIYFALGFNKSLESIVQTKAIEKRKSFERNKRAEQA